MGLDISNPHLEYSHRQTIGAMRRLLRRLWYAIRRSRVEADLADEMAFHREMTLNDLKARGLSASDATRAAARAFGSSALAGNQSRDVWIWPWLQDLGQDVRFGARLLWRERRYSIAAVTALALGLGATTTAFTFVNSAVFKSLPFADADRLVWIRTVDARGRELGVSYTDARDWREAARTLSHLVISVELPMNVSEETLPPQRFSGSYVSPDMFDMVGRRPMLGRTFLPEDNRFQAPRVAIIAYSVWQSRYGGDPSIVGRAIRINDVQSTIIGVMPEGFQFPFVGEMWVPLGQTSGPPDTLDARRGNRGVLIFAFGRLADGIALAEARAEVSAIAGRLARNFPATNDGIGVGLEPLDELYWGGEFGLRRMLVVMMIAVSFVLLMACVNIANLQLARAIHRSREIAIRSSLGATRWRIVRQLFVESVLLATIAGVVGFFLFLNGVAIFTASVDGMYGFDGPSAFWMKFTVDARVYAFLAIVCLGTSLVFGLAPALHISKSGSPWFKDGGRTVAGGSHAHRWTAALIVAQLALTLVLLAGAGLMSRSFVALYRAGQVLDTSNMITMQLALGIGKYPQPADIKQFFRRLDEQLATVRSLSAVTVASDIPMLTVINALRQLTIDGRATATNENPPSVAYLYIGPRYFETLKLRLLRGREFTEDDGAPGREAAIINERFASMFFPNTDPIGQRIRLVNAAAPSTPQPWFTIVGVSPTVPQVIFRGTEEAVAYVALRGEPAPHRFVSIIARAEGDRAAIVSALRGSVRAIDPDLPGYYVRTLDEVLATSRWRQSVLGSVFSLVAGIALLLASIGLYAVTSHGVTERTQEIGIRVALGARSPQVVWLFARRTLLQLLIGLFLGLAGAIAVGRALEQFLVRTPPNDPLALSLVSLLLIAVATAASVWPATRAARVDPVVALRSE
jgi:putative ABC transport system permease protein